MAANIIISGVSITPNPVDALGTYRISVDATELSAFAFVGGYVGSYVNVMDSEIPDKLPLAYVGEYIKT